MVSAGDRVSSARYRLPLREYVRRTGGLNAIVTGHVAVYGPMRAHVDDRLIVDEHGRCRFIGRPRRVSVVSQAHIS